MRIVKFALWTVILPIILAGVQTASAQNAADLDNATCLSCHGNQQLTARDAERNIHSLFVPADQFANSVHGNVLRCVDCHTTVTALPHKNGSNTVAEWDRTRLAVKQNCGNCHAAGCAGYTETYHGQVVAMGFADIATCADCHGSHAILPASDPASSVSPANLLKTCQKCHPGRDAGLRHVPAARHDRRLRALSLYVARLEIREFGGRRRARVLLDAFGALVLSRISRPPAAEAATACARRRAAAERRPLLPALERHVALGPPVVRGQHHPAGRDRRDIALSEPSLGAGARARNGRAGDRRHHSPGRRGVWSRSSPRTLSTPPFTLRGTGRPSKCSGPIR